MANLILQKLPMPVSDSLLRNSPIHKSTIVRCHSSKWQNIGQR